MNNYFHKVVLGAALASLAFTAQAAKKVPLTDAHYSGAVIVGSKSAVSVEAATFDPAQQISGTVAYAGGIYVPVAWKVKKQFQFTQEDQKVLASILNDELVRLGVFDPTGNGSSAPVKISLNFKEGTYENMRNEYSLTLEMIVLDESNRRFGKTYMVNSNEKATGWQKMNTSVWQGKKQLVQITLDKLIPDIQDFLKRTQPPEILRVPVPTSQSTFDRERYEGVRARLISEGWKPIAAKCSPQNICGEHEELSTDMETVVSCGIFKKDDKTATVCGESMPDALLVTSIKIEPAK